MIYSKFPQVVGIIYLLVIVGLKSLLSCWLSTKEHFSTPRGCSQLVTWPSPISNREHPSKKFYLPQQLQLIFLNLVYCSLPLFEEPINTEEWKSTVMEIFTHRIQRRVDSSPCVMVRKVFLFWLCDHNLAVYMVQQDLIFLHLHLCPSQGSISDEPEYSSCERLSENMCWELHQSSHYWSLVHILHQFQGTPTEKILTTPIYWWECLMDDHVS